jgi:dTDP-4-amino-4,6-dideoxy-D-glucose acyltransferase
MLSFYNLSELKKLGFNKLGKDVLISRKASIYGAARISIGNHVRIDDFCVLSAGTRGIYIGNYIHIAVFTSIIGEGRILIGDFSGISSRVSIYSSNDDYTGEFLSNPTVPSLFKNVHNSDVKIGNHVLIGSGTIILPGVTINVGVAISTLSLVNKDCDEFYIYKGNPAKKVVPRKRDLLFLEEEFRNSALWDC